MQNAHTPAVDLGACARREAQYPWQDTEAAALSYVAKEIGAWVGTTFPPEANNKGTIDRLFDGGTIDKLNSTIGKAIEADMRRIGVTDEEIKRLKQSDIGMLYAWLALRQVVEPTQDHLERGTPAEQLITVPSPEDLFAEAAGEALHDRNANAIVKPQAPRKVTPQGPRRVQPLPLSLEKSRRDKAVQYLRAAREARSGSKAQSRD